MEEDFMSYAECLELFVGIFNANKADLADFSNRNESEHLLIDQFHDIVVDKCKVLLRDNDNRDHIVFGATEYQDIGDDFNYAREHIFRIVAKTECDLLNANSIVGLSLNEIHSHFLYEYDRRKPFSFVWKIPLDLMHHRIYVPTIDEIREKHEWEEKLDKMAEKYRRSQNKE